MPWRHPFWMKATEPWTCQTCQTPAPGWRWGTSHWGPAVLAGGKTPPTWGTASWSPRSRTGDPVVNNGINHEQRLRISYGCRMSTGITPVATFCTSTAFSSCQTLQAQSTFPNRLITIHTAWSLATSHIPAKYTLYYTCRFYSFVSYSCVAPTFSPDWNKEVFNFKM